jgi:hypothetical protein
VRISDLGGRLFLPIFDLSNQLGIKQASRVVESGVAATGSS